MQAMVARVTKALAALALVALAAPVRAVNVDPSADGPFAVGVATLAFADAAPVRSNSNSFRYRGILVLRSARLSACLET